MPRRKGVSFTQRDVVEAAIACIADDGPNALGVNAVARRMGIKPPSLYNHVAGNQDLRRLVAIEGWRQLGEAVLPAIEPGLDPRQNLLRFSTQFRKFANQHKALYHVLSNTSLDPQDPDFIPVATGLEALYDLLLSMGLEQEDLIHSVRFLRASVEGFVKLELAGQFRLNTSADDSFAFLQQSIIDALEARIPPHASPIPQNMS